MPHALPKSFYADDVAPGLLSAMPRRRVRSAPKIKKTEEELARLNDDAMAQRILDAARKAEKLVAATERYLERSTLYKTILERVEQDNPHDCTALQQAVHAYIRGKAEQHSMPYHPDQAETVRSEIRARIFRRLTDLQQEVRKLTITTGCEQSIQLVLAASTGVLLAHATVH